jgi:hypothetical protein
MPLLREAIEKTTFVKQGQFEEATELFSRRCLVARGRQAGRD